MNLVCYYVRQYWKRMHNLHVGNWNSDICIYGYSSVLWAMSCFDMECFLPIKEIEKRITQAGICLDLRHNLYLFSDIEDALKTIDIFYDIMYEWTMNGRKNMYERNDTL